MKRLTKLQEATLVAMLERELHDSMTFEADNASAIGGISAIERFQRRATRIGHHQCAYQRGLRWVDATYRTFRSLERRKLIEHHHDGWHTLTPPGRAIAERLRMRTPRF